MHDVRRLLQCCMPSQILPGMLVTLRDDDTQGEEALDPSTLLYGKPRLNTFPGDLLLVIAVNNDRSSVLVMLPDMRLGWLEDHRLWHIW